MEDSRQHHSRKTTGQTDESGGNPDASLKVIQGRSRLSSVSWCGIVATWVWRQAGLKTVQWHREWKLHLSVHPMSTANLDCRTSLMITLFVTNDLTRRFHGKLPPNPSLLHRA